MSKKYRIYAKIVGYILPNNEIEIDHCIIKKMSFSEQRKRKFFPLRNERKEDFNNPWYKSYITYPTNADFRELKTKYVIYTDIEEYRGERDKPKDVGGFSGDVNSALGIAVRRFDRVVNSLCLCASDLMIRKVNRYLDTKYDYQICKIYELKDGREINTEKPFMGGWGGMINAPATNFNYADIDMTLMSRMLKSKNIIFIKSLRYLFKGVRGMHNNIPVEKIFIDYVKSIEIIVNQFKGKSFNKKLLNVSKILDVPKELIKEIKDIWKSRSRGDFAHANTSLTSLNLPPQFPEPSDSEFRYFNLFGICSMLILKYFKYIENEIEVFINDSQSKYMSEDYNNELIDVNMGEYFSFYTKISNRKILTPLLKREIANNFKCKIKEIKLKSFKNNKAVFKINSNTISV